VNLRDIDLNLTLVFEAMMAERSATRAGKRLGLSQSAVSNALGRLRDALRDPLFVRAGPTMVPTTRALRLAGPVAAALAQLRNAFEQRNELDLARSTYRARIATSDYAEIVAVRRVVAELRRSAPRMTLHCRRLANLFEAPATALERGELEFAFGSFSGRIRDGLRWLPVVRDRWVVAGRGARGLSVRELSRRPHVQVMFGAESIGLVGHALRELGHSRFAPIITAQFGALPHYLRGTDLLAVLPERLARELDVAAVRPPLKLPPIELGLVWHERLDADPAHQWLRECFTRVFDARSRSSS
jgi:DNA-binding transcriptional LysR family regulator